VSSVVDRPLVSADAKGDGGRVPLQDTSAKSRPIAATTGLPGRFIRR